MKEINFPICLYFGNKAATMRNMEQYEILSVLFNQETPDLKRKRNGEPSESVIGLDYDDAADLVEEFLEKIKVERERVSKEFAKLKGVTEQFGGYLFDVGIKTIEDLAYKNPKDLIDLDLNETESKVACKAAYEVVNSEDEVSIIDIKGINKDNESVFVEAGYGDVESIASAEIKSIMELGFDETKAKMIVGSAKNKMK